MKNKGLYIRLSEDEMSILKSLCKLNGKTASALIRDVLKLDCAQAKPSRTVEKAIPSVPKETKEILSIPAVDPTRCAGGVHCPMSPVNERGGKWYCEHHSPKKV